MKYDEMSSEDKIELFSQDLNNEELFESLTRDELVKALELYKDSNVQIDNISKAFYFERRGFFL
jgi:hypothetical protein